jgi:hypothetical protein
MSTDQIEGQIVAYLTKCRIEGALWTSDIAHGVKKPTATVRRVLQKMESSGAVVRVVVGNPSSWKLTRYEPTYTDDQLKIAVEAILADERVFPSQRDREAAAVKLIREQREMNPRQAMDFHAALTKKGDE